MKKYIKLDNKQFNEHLKDGMVKTCVMMLRQVCPYTLEYATAYTRLYWQIVRLQQNVGPLANDVYLELLTLNHPMYYDPKGGVQNE